MSKRRISEQQKRRIELIHNQRRQRAQDTASQTTSDNLGPEQPGRVITQFGKTLIVEANNGELIHCTIRQNLGAVVSGDFIVWQPSRENSGVVVAVESRTSLLQKPGFGGKLKPMAANINQIVIVTSVVPEPNPYLIDRYLVAAENLPATPIILINKIDLLNDENKNTIETLKTLYTNLGYRVINASFVIDQGFSQLLQSLQNQTSIFVGLSGVGKSSLIKHLLPDMDIRIGELSAASGEGTHTTTHSTLYHLAQGGDLIDSPGVRDFGLWNMSAQDILQGFREIKPLAAQCRFSDCAHENEPDCALLHAVEEGKVRKQRFVNYKKMLAEYASIRS
ncbi:MAG: small ribosomal subunit biogenesis GTPase RsgA [Gammaproteobacteria bacterium]|nr:small ribosomal subunit biogenesis GTPase RsgA [Gammaproteobacteria bacterium]